MSYVIAMESTVLRANATGQWFGLVSPVQGHARALHCAPRTGDLRALCTKHLSDTLHKTFFLHLVKSELPLLSSVLSVSIFHVNISSTTFFLSLTS